MNHSQSPRAAVEAPVPRRAAAAIRRAACGPTALAGTLLFAAALLWTPASHAATVPYNLLTAPDAVSRAVLARPVARLEEGALLPQDIPAAIHRNFPQVVEQNFASMNATESSAFLNQLSDVELAHLAQRYVNANADAGRTGRLLLVTAARLDGEHLARLSRFFGYAPVYDAVLAGAPLKAQSFAQHASVMSPAPVAGAQVAEAGLPLSLAGGAAAAGAVTLAGAGSTRIAAAGTPFKPAVNMTLDEIYTGFRGAAIGRGAVTAALFETGMYSGVYLYGAWKVGYAFGSELTELAQTYAPDWYYGTFVNWVGDAVTWTNNWVNETAALASTTMLGLGSYQQSTAPTWSVPPGAQETMRDTGGDFGVTEAWNDYYVTNVCTRGAKCPTRPTQ